MNPCRPSSVTGELPDPLEAIVQTYLQNNAEGEDRYLQYYRIQKSLAAAVEKATMAELPGGQRFSHQRRIPGTLLAKAKNVLLKADLTKPRTFDELHTLVRRKLAPIAGIGELTIYDTAHRIGAHLGLRPEFLYLHAGVRSGAKALGLEHRAAKLPMSALPKAFQKLLPEQVEDCLCIYKTHLKALKQS